MRGLGARGDIQSFSARLTSSNKSSRNRGKGKHPREIRQSKAAGRAHRVLGHAYCWEVGVRRTPWSLLDNWVDDGAIYSKGEYRYFVFGFDLEKTMDLFFVS